MRMRTIAYNVYSFRGWPKEAGITPEEMIQSFVKAMKKYRSDIITLSEAQPEFIVQNIARELGMQALRFPSIPEEENCPGTLLTHLEILESANCPLISKNESKGLFTRHWGRALLRTDRGEVAIHSAHLYPGEEEIRQREIREIIKVIEEDKKLGRSILLQGDLNHLPGTIEYNLWIKAGLIDTFQLAGTGSAETCRPSDSSPKEDQPNQRIDYIFAYGPIVEHLSKCQVLSEPPFRVNPHAERLWSLSDHLPVMATFE